MRIPNRFKLFGATIEVEHVETLRLKDNAHGSASYRRNKIELQPSTPGWPLDYEQIAQTFCHEVIHHIFHGLGEHDLRDNEKLVESFGNLLHQVLSTMEFDKPSVEVDPKVEAWMKDRRDRDRAVGALLLLAHEGVISSGRARELMEMSIYQQRLEYDRILATEQESI